MQKLHKKCDEFYLNTFIKLYKLIKIYKLNMKMAPTKKKVSV